MIKANTFSCGALILIERCTRKEFGFVAAKRRKATITAKTESAIFKITFFANAVRTSFLAVEVGNSTLMSSQLVRERLGVNPFGFSGRTRATRK